MKMRQVSPHRSQSTPSSIPVHLRNIASSTEGGSLTLDGVSSTIPIDGDDGCLSVLILAANSEGKQVLYLTEAETI